MDKVNLLRPEIPNWMIWMQTICFSVLYTIWGLPETILIRHICLIVGALVGAYEIYQYRSIFLSKGAVSIWLLLTLFIWITIHLIFFSNNFSLQYKEFTTIWKRAILGSIFALGFAMGIANIKNEDKECNILWTILCLGIFGPTFIFYVKYMISVYGICCGLAASDYWRLYETSAPFYVPKTYYVSFCFPALTMSLGALILSIEKNGYLKLNTFTCIVAAASIFLMFFLLNIKNGIIWSSIAIAIFATFFICRLKKFHTKSNFGIFIIGILFGALLVIQNIEKTHLFKNFIEDSKIALDSGIDHKWKYNDRNYPINSEGISVSHSTYERVGWSKAALSFISENPFGYGLIEASFGKYAKEKWPDSALSQSHSGWLDLALGIGWPGLCVIFALLIILLYLMPLKFDGLNCFKNKARLMVWLCLLSIALSWITTELCQKVYFEQFIFFLAMGAGSILFDSNKSLPLGSMKVYA